MAFDQTSTSIINNSVKTDDAEKNKSNKDLHYNNDTKMEILIEKLVPSKTSSAS